jgi:hypothetical protein
MRVREVDCCAVGAEVTARTRDVEAIEPDCVTGVMTTVGAAVVAAVLVTPLLGRPLETLPTVELGLDSAPSVVVFVAVGAGVTAVVGVAGVTVAVGEGVRPPVEDVAVGVTPVRPVRAVVGVGAPAVAAVGVRLKFDAAEVGVGEAAPAFVAFSVVVFVTVVTGVVVVAPNVVPVVVPAVGTAVPSGTTTSSEAKSPSITRLPEGLT